MTDDDRDSRLAELEARVADLERELESYRRTYALLLANADIEALDAPACPECEDGTLTKQSGLSWAKAVCTSCGSSWTLS
ncbi:MAG: hypothetical protein ABEI11_04480 [Haloarculaceae archaeon]